MDRNEIEKIFQKTELGKHLSRRLYDATVDHSDYYHNLEVFIMGFNSGSAQKEPKSTLSKILETIGGDISEDLVNALEALV